MFMKAILHNKEDDLHFLLKCLVEELEEKTILKAEDDGLESEIFDSQDEFEALEQLAIEEAEQDKPKEIIDEDDETERKMLFNSNFYPEVKKVLMTERSKKKRDLTQEEKLNLVYTVRKKYYDRFVQENKPMEFKLGNTQYSYTVKEIKETWNKYSRSRKSLLDKEKLLSDVIRLNQLQNELVSFERKGRKVEVKSKFDDEVFAFDSPTPKTRFGEYAPSSKEGKMIAAFVGKRKRLRKQLATIVMEQTRLSSPKEEGKGYIENPKERKKAAEKLDKKEAKTKQTLENLLGEFEKDWKEKGFAIEPETINEKKNPKAGKPILYVNREATPKEIKELKTQIEKLTAEVTKNKKRVEAGANNSIRISSLKVLAMTPENTGQAVRDLKALLEEESVKAVLGKKINPKEKLEGKSIIPKIPNITLPHHYIPFKGAYDDKKLRAFLDTDAKAKGMEQSRSRTGTMLSDGQGVKREAISRIFNYLSYLMDNIKEEAEGSTKKKVVALKNLITNQNKKIVQGLEEGDLRERITKYTKPFYVTLQKELKDLKEISKLQGTSDEKRMLEAKKIFEGTKYGLEMVRDAITILQGDSVSDDKIKRLVDIGQKALSRGTTSDTKSRKNRELLNKKRKALLETRKELNELNSKISGQKEGKEKENKKLLSLPSQDRKDKNNQTVNKIKNTMAELDKKIKENEKSLSTLKKDIDRQIKALQKLLTSQETSDVKRRKDKKQKYSFKKADLIGKEAYKYFDVVMPTGGKYYFTRRQTPMYNGLAGFSALETIVQDIQKTLEDEKILNAIKGTYQKLTGKAVFEQDSATTDKKKQLKRALDKLPDFVKRRVEMKKMLSPIPDFIVRDMIKEEAKLSTGLLSALKNLSLVGLIDDNSPVSFGVEDTTTWKISEMERKKVSVRGQKFAPIFALVTPEFTRDLKQIEADAKVGKLENIGAEQVREYWETMFDKVRSKADALKKLEEAKEPSKAEFKTAIEALNNLAIKTKEQEKIEKDMEAFIELMDNKQEILTVLSEIEVFVDEITKLRKEYEQGQSQQMVQVETFEESLSKYANSMIDRFDRYVNSNKEIPVEVSIRSAIAAEERIKGKGFTAKAEKELRERIEKHNKKAQQARPRLFEYNGFITISARDSETIMVNVAKNKNQKSLQELFESNISDEDLEKEIVKEGTIILEEQKREYEAGNIDYKDTAYRRTKENIKEGKERMRGAIKDRPEIKEGDKTIQKARVGFENLVKVFKTKTKVFDFSKLKFNIEDKNIVELLSNEVLGKELATMIDLTDAFDAYRKHHKKLQKKHLENIEGQTKLQTEADDSIADILKNFRGSFSSDLVSRDEELSADEKKDEKYEDFKIRIEFTSRGGKRAMAESNPRFAEDLAREDKEFKTLLEEFKKEKLEEDKKEKERIKFLEEQKREMEAKK